MAKGGRSRLEGIIARHRLHCASATGASCDCRPSYQAQAYSPRDRRTIRKTFRSLADARAWRIDTKSALRAGTIRAPTRTTINDTAETWLAAAKAGVVRTRSGEPKPSALRAYEQVLRATVLPKLGHLRLSSVTRNTLQDLVDEMVGNGMSPSTVKNTVLPLRAIYSSGALARGDRRQPDAGTGAPRRQGPARAGRASGRSARAH